MFNGNQFFDDYNIPYIESGKNVQKGWINITCPFHNDNSEHLGFNYEKGYANCWHCGYISIFNLIKTLLPNENTHHIKQRYETGNKVHINKKEENRIIPDKVIIPGESLKEVHKEYLRSRNFNPSFLESKYKLRGTNNLGDYRFRIIAPIFYNGKLVSYQGRDITGLSKQTKSDIIIFYVYTIIFIRLYLLSSFSFGPSGSISFYRLTQTITGNRIIIIILISVGFVCFGRIN